MRAIDANLIVRYLTGDDGLQAVRARKVIDSGDVFVSLTVLLEAEWVLRSVFGFDRRQTVGGLRRIAGLPGVMVEDAPAARDALGWTEQGLDFADALHLARAGACDGFVTFDKTFARLGKGLSGIPMQLL